MLPSFSITLIEELYSFDNSPLGPVMVIKPEAISTFTFSGMGIGFFPILDTLTILLFFYQIKQRISPPSLCCLASISVKIPFEVEIKARPKPPKTVGISLYFL
jgi:hypothetical protein